MKGERSERDSDRAEQHDQHKLKNNMMGICGGLVMASVIDICVGLAGPKSGNVEKVLVLKALFEGSRKPGLF